MIDTPLRIVILIGSNRAQRFGEVVARWDPDRQRRAFVSRADDVVVQVRSNALSSEELIEIANRDLFYWRDPNSDALELEVPNATSMASVTLRKKASGLMRAIKIRNVG